MLRNELVSYLDSYLRINEIADYGPQGLQVEGAREITRIAFTVDTGLPCIEAALKVGAQMLVVHHGLFWGTVEPLRGPLGRKVRRLMKEDLNLYAAHLALDAHPEVGNNVELARLLGLAVDSWWCDARGTDIGVLCPAPDGLTRDQFVSTLGERLASEPRVLAHGPAILKRIAIVSGSAISHAAEAAALGADTFLTGETSHASFYAAQDHGLNVVFGGHYATETIGLKALGKHLNGRFGLETVFIDFPTGM